MPKDWASMIKSFEFYFDFASPYSYLAHKQIRRIEEKEKRMTSNVSKERNELEL